MRSSKALVVVVVALSLVDLAGRIAPTTAQQHAWGIDGFYVRLWGYNQLGCFHDPWNGYNVQLQGLGRPSVFLFRQRKASWDR